MLPAIPPMTLIFPPTWLQMLTGSGNATAYPKQLRHSILLIAIN